MPLKTCPHCGHPIRPGDRTRNAIYTRNAQGIPLSDQVHYPDCYAQLIRPVSRTYTQGSLIPCPTI